MNERQIRLNKQKLDQIKKQIETVKRKENTEDRVFEKTQIFLESLIYRKEEKLE